MVKCQAPLVVSKFLTSKCKEIVIVVLRAIISFLSNAVNTKHPTNNTLVLNQVKKKIYIYLSNNTLLKNNYTIIISDLRKYYWKCCSYKKFNEFIARASFSLQDNILYVSS